MKREFRQCMDEERRWSRRAFVRMTIAGVIGMAACSAVTCRPAAADESSDAVTAADPNASLLPDNLSAASSADSATTSVRGVNPTTLWGGFVDATSYPPSSMVETNLGDVVAESFMRAASDARDAGILPDDYADAPIVALERGGNLRGSLPRGVISTDDVDAIIAPASRIGVVAVTPRILHDVLESAVATLAAQDLSTGMLDGMPSGDTPQLAGLVATCDPGLPQGSRVTSMALESAGELDPADDVTQILLVTCDYALSGAYPYEAVAQCDVLADLGGEADVVKSYLASLMTAGLDMGASSGGSGAASSGKDSPSALGALPVIAGTKGRLRLEGSYEPHDWDATLQVVDPVGNACSNAAITLLVDAREYQDVVTDAEGYASLHLSDGPHAVCLASQPAVPARADDSSSGASSVRFEKGEQTYSNRLDAAADVLANAAADAGEGPLTSSAMAAGGKPGISSGNPGGEAYVNNYLGIGLVEDDVRSYPRLILALSAS